MEYKDLVETFNAYCAEKGVIPPRETMMDLRSIWENYKNYAPGGSIVELSKKVADLNAKDEASLRRVFIYQAISDVFENGWSPDTSHPLRRPPNPTITGLEVETILRAAKEAVRKDFFTDGFLLLSMLLSGLKWSEAVDIDWSKIFLDRKTPVFGVGGRELALSGRVNQEDFRSVVALAKTQAEGKVFSQGRGGLRSNLNQLIKMAGKEWVTPNVLRNRWLMDEFVSGGTTKDVSRRAGVKQEYLQRMYNNMIKKMREGRS